MYKTERGRAIPAAPTKQSEHAYPKKKLSICFICDSNLIGILCFLIATKCTEPKNVHFNHLKRTVQWHCAHLSCSQPPPPFVPGTGLFFRT